MDPNEPKLTLLSRSCHPVETVVEGQVVSGDYSRLRRCMRIFEITHSPKTTFVLVDDSHASPPQARQGRAIDLPPPSVRRTRDTSEFLELRYHARHAATVPLSWQNPTW